MRVRVYIHKPTHTHTHTHRWMDRLRLRTEQLLKSELPFVLLGDYNVCPENFDCFSIDAMMGDAVVHPESRRKYRAMSYLGLTDAHVALGKAGYTYWDYRVCFDMPECVRYVLYTS